MPRAEKEAMKFGMRELIAMGRSSDPVVLARQEELWDQASERYREYLASIRPYMAPGLKQLDEAYYLHDALVLGMGRQGNKRVIMLQLDTPPQPLISLTNDLVGEPMIDTAAACTRNGPLDWQQDELEILPGEPSTWVQAILLNNGWEVRLHFHDVQVQELEALLPACGNGQDQAATGASQPA